MPLPSPGPPCSRRKLIGKYTHFRPSNDVLGPTTKICVGSRIHMEGGRQTFIQEFTVYNPNSLHGMKIIPARLFDKEAVIWSGREHDAKIAKCADELPPFFHSKAPPAFKGWIAIRAR